jgi:hypothetical protein
VSGAADYIALPGAGAIPRLAPEAEKREHGAEAASRHPATNRKSRNAARRLEDHPLRIEFCNGCGAPLEARWSKIVIVCRYCGSQNAPGGKLDPVPSSIPDDGRLRLAIDGRTYLILGRLGVGDSSEVYLGRWVQRLGETVVVKILRSSADRDLLVREHAYLRRLHESPVPGTSHFANLIPEPIACGPVRLKHGERLISVFRWKPGFLHSLEDVIRFHSQGVDAHVAVWTGKRLLEILHWSHQSGVLHGAVLPPHVLIHPRNHGAMLIGWSTAMADSARDQAKIAALSRHWADWYPVGREGSRAADIAMAARCVLAMAGARSFSEGGTLPNPVSALLIDAARMAFDDAWSLRERLSERALDALGQPSYRPLWMPGWPPVPSQ